MLSASAHKFNGPKGVGFLYIRNGTSIKPYADGGAQEFGMRAGTENIASIVAMAVALKNNIDNIQLHTQKLLNLERVLLKNLLAARIDFLLNGGDDKLPGNINISFRNFEGEMLLHRLDLMGIYVSTGSACNSHNTQISHVLEAIRLPDEYAKGTIRISLSSDNNEDDVISIANALIKIIKK